MCYIFLVSWIVYLTLSTYKPLSCSNIVHWFVNLKLPHIIRPMARAINVISDDRNCVKYKRTIQHSEQLWLYKLNWWWNHRTWETRNIGVPPVIEMQIVTERMLIKVLFFITFLIEQLITNVQYSIKRVYKMSKTNFFVFLWILYVGKGSQNYTEYRQLNTNFYFFM